MDEHRFDALTRALIRSAPRRAVAATMAAGAVTALLGRNAEEIAAKKRKRKKKTKQPSSCTPSCFTKACGQDNGCGSRCTVQAGCETDEACVNGECVSNTCTPACTGNYICQPNGSCTCPPGLKECPPREGQPGYCHECCNDGAFSLVPDPECVGNPNGQFCADYFGELILRCMCPEANCNGRCGRCCDNTRCVFLMGPGSVCTANLACVCPQGRFHCGTELGCVDTMTDSGACGQFCRNCPPETPSCVNGACCTNDCGPANLSQPCCIGRCVDKGTFLEPDYVCE